VVRVGAGEGGKGWADVSPCRSAAPPPNRQKGGGGEAARTNDMRGTAGVGVGVRVSVGSLC